MKQRAWVRQRARVSQGQIETITVEPTGNNIEITTTDATLAPLEFAHFCEKCRKGFTHKANLHKHKKEHSEAAKPNSNVPVVEKAKEPLNKHKNFKFSGIITCDKCEAVFISQPLLKEHNEKYHEEGQETEADAHEPIHQLTQLHCALYEDTMCQFQCTTLRELNSHIEKTHRKKPDIPCTVCKLLFKNLDDLSKHTTTDHKKCENLNNLKEKQTSYKPCDYFLEDRCTNEECRFNHTKLLQGQQICQKCGKTFTTKRDLLKHIEEIHVNLICHKFLKNDCNVQICFFRHILPAIGDAVATTPFSPPTALDFPALHTAQPAMWRQGEGQSLQTQMSTMSLQAQEKSSLETQVMAIMTQIMPQVLNLLKGTMKN